MPKILVVGLTMVAVFALMEIKVYREPSQESFAISALRAVASSQRAYAVVNGGYAMSLKMLAARCPGRQQPFISPDLAGDPAVRRGYEIRLQAAADAPTGHVDCHGNPTTGAYYATAVPRQRTRTAVRAFAVDQSNVIWYDETGSAPIPPFSETGALKRLR
jgi:hypothetical protein